MRPLVLLLLLVGLGRPALAADSLYVAGAPVHLAGGADAFFMRPVWSPDGARLAATGADYRGLWVIDAADGGARQLTDEQAAGFGAAWSPDGTRLVARVARFEGPRRYNAVKVFDAADGSATALTDYRTLMPGLPQWSAGGDRVVLYGRGRLETFAGGASASPAKAAPDAPTFFIKDDGIARTHPAAEAPTVETLRTPFDDAQLLNLSPSPDGTRLAFEVAGGHLHVMRADGTGLVDLGPGNRPQWSPDGRWVVYMRAEDDGYRFTASDLYGARADGSGAPVRLTWTDDRLEMNPSWSPDGRAIAFDAFGEGAVYLLPVTTR